MSGEHRAAQRIEEAQRSGATVLDLDDLGLRTVPESIGQLSSVTSLTLNRNQLTTLPDSISQLSNLRALSVSSNQLTTLPESIGLLTNLKSFVAQSNHLTVLPESFGQLTNLTRMYFGRNQLTLLPDLIGRLIGLTELVLNGNQLTTVPEWIGQLTSLSTLNLGDNLLDLLPESIGQLTNLRGLYLWGNRLTALPDWIAELTKLTGLTLGGNRLTALPDWIGRLSNLHNLSIHTNQLATLPESIGQLTELRSLSLHGNRLTVLPISISRLTKLEALDAGANKLTTLPDWIGQLKSVTELFLGGNQLTALPTSISELANLTGINLGSNRLTSLPDSIGQLANLNKLTAHGNRLTVLPDWIGQLTELRKLNVHGNQLAALPNSLGQLTELEELTYQGNPLVYPPTAVSTQGALAVLAFLRAAQLNTERLWISKLLIVGEGGAGKTTLLKVLAGSAADPQEKTTHGLNIQALPVPHPTEQDVIMRLSAWDFGGQHVYHATHQFFLTDQSLFLLVWSARAGWEQSKGRYWLDIIKARTGGESRTAAPVILVSTHSHYRAPDLPISELRVAYPNIVGSVEIDSLAENHNGFDMLHRAIAEAASRELPLMGLSWPSTWLSASQAVRGSNRNRMGIEAFNDLLATAGVADTTDQQAVTGTLHQLGEILHYAEDPELSGTVVLKPAWLSERIAAILDCKPVANRHGLLLAEDITREWGDVGNELQKQLMFMMDRYDVSYRITDTVGKARAIVVDRLPWEPPNFRRDWDAALDTLGHRELRLHYTIGDTVPPGIPGWFIAHAHRFADPRHRPWRTGVLLAHPDGRHIGLLRFDQHTRTVQLSVRGPRPAGFLNVLDMDFTQATLSRYPGLVVTRAVPCFCRHNCAIRFPLDTLLRFQEEGQASVQCIHSGDDIDISMLIDGISLTHTAADGPQHIASAIARIEETVNQTRTLMQEQGALLNEDAEQRHLDFARLMNWIKVSAPTVFTVTKKSMHMPGTHRYVLRLYCAEPNAIHQLPNDVGCYPITALEKWAGALARRLTTVAALLSSITGLTGTILGHSAPDLLGRNSEDLKKVRELLNTLKEGTNGIGDHLTNADMPGSDISTEADARSIEELLKTLDPHRHWGGLSKTIAPSGLTLYLCRDHARAYKNPSPRPHGL